ncbi:MAG TPA: metallopeptidase TldD-related protein, partial [Ktedonobacterales bacterium]
MLQEETRTQMMATAQRLADTLRATPAVDAWQVATTRREEAQVYLIGAEIEEARRVVSSEDSSVTLHNLHTPHAAETPDAQQAEQAQQGAALGATTLTILSDEAADSSRLAARLRDGALMASLTDNQPFTLPAAPARGFPVVEAEDLTLGASLEAAVERAGQQLQAALRLTPGVRLGSAEIYATRAHHTLINSQGLSASKRETSAFLDLVLIAGEGERAAEFHAELRRRRLSDLHVERMIAAYGAFALHALHATAPDAWEGPVILSGEAAAQLFNPVFGGPIVAHTSGEMAYQKLSRLAVGEFITPEEPRGDRLTLTSDATRPYGSRTSAYDSSGVPAQQATLIEQGVFKRPWAEAKYAQYLGLEATGDLGNLTVNRGSTPLERLRSADQGPVYEVVAFSLFNPDPVTGDFSSEIRLGYRYDAAGVRPIKGGSLVG